MKKTQNRSTPDITQLADLYTQLARMEDAGIGNVQAFNSLIETGSSLSAALYASCNHLKSGNSIAESGYRAGLFNEIDRELIRAGEFSGTLGHIYQQLANYYTDKARHRRKIKSHLFLPLSILLLALLISPIPALITANMTALEYIQSSVVVFVYLLLLMYVVWRLPFLLTQGRGRFLGLREFVFFVQLTLPVLAPWIIRRQIREFLLILGLLLDAGVPIIDALPKASSTVKNALLAEHINKANDSIQKGRSLGAALAQVREFKPSTLQIITVGEQSGKLASSLLHFARLEAEVISLQEEMLAEWFPRIVYILVSIWMTYSIVGAYQAYFSSLNQAISTL